MSDVDDLVLALQPVARAFTSLNVAHFVGGSVASSFHGALRSTLDVDLVARLKDSQVGDLLAALGDEYYASEAAIRDAIRRRGCFNLIHFATSFKVDVFISRDREFDRSAFSRARAGQLGGDSGLIVPIASAEDTVISKLEWYRLGNESSQRQWDDITKVLKLLGDHADISYLRRSAQSVGVADLLARLLSADGHIET